MAAYSYLQPLDRFSLIHFIRTYSNNQPEDSPDDFKQLDAAYDLSRGMNVTGQIPIKMAMAIVLKESKVQAIEIEQAKKMFKESFTEGAIILRRAANDETKVLITLLQNKKSLTSLDKLIKVITTDPLHAGFKANVTNLSETEWSEMYGFVLILMKKER
jgi:hypothetical protein